MNKEMVFVDIFLPSACFHKKKSRLFCGLVAEDLHFQKKNILY